MKKIIFFDADSGCRELSTYYDIIRHEQNSFAGGTIEMVPKGYNKAIGNANVCKLYNVPLSDTICFGDSNNDLAMGNASSKINYVALYFSINDCNTHSFYTYW